ncbi:HlyD family efflux transporter periplasmic adaptor subunit [Fusibacter paucivorans]|uniref:HlyD family efflux transporter periplasmic adaptor subunit n=1 Tax=Fusibacter paucivorans TaxID=76009 RepID=A0ABS5PLA3_9FIRM|nr:biotin/lipoyl-binding protein [Fusibacter paucivorans]MBS7525361.1 HlyD family efflux transporter periplasmic adaptor subunit [Fusibacter paucivorans]
MSNTIFRKNSLDQISSPEHLSEYVKITGTGVWSLLVGSIILLCAIGLWAVFGDIPNTINANGVIFPQNGVIATIPVTGGRINDIRVKVGDYVEAGQIIAVIDQEELVDAILAYQNSDEIDEATLQSLYSNYERQAILYAPVSGTVIYARNTNETVSDTEPVARIVKQSQYADNQQVVCYVPSATAKRLKEGMAVQVSPDFASREEYGYIYGHITSIGAYPVTKSGILASLGSEQYAEDLWSGTNAVEVRMTLAVDADAQNKLKWSNPKGASLSLGIGTYTNIQIVLKHYHPYELIF